VGNILASEAIKEIRSSKTKAEEILKSASAQRKDIVLKAIVEVN
jgi:hypothetical protein